MELMRRMNAKLDLGWKMTNMNCITCGGVTLAQPSISIQELYCPKCDKTFAQLTTQENSQEDEEQQLFNEVLKQSTFNSKQISQKNKPLSKQAQANYEQLDYELIQRQSRRSDQVSKKIGQKLISGWTMLEQACQDCNVPLMKSKKGQKLCMGCNIDYAAVQMKEKQNQMPNNGKTKLGQIKSQKIEEIKPFIAKNTNSHANPQRQGETQKTQQYFLNRIQLKTLGFLQKQIDSAIKNNCISALKDLLDLTIKAKSLI